MLSGLVQYNPLTLPPVIELGLFGICVPEDEGGGERRPGRHPLQVDGEAEEGRQRQAQARPRAAGVCMRRARSKMAFRWGRNGCPMSPWVRARVAVGSIVTEHPPRKRPS